MKSVLRIAGLVVLLGAICFAIQRQQRRLKAAASPAAPHVASVEPSDPTPAAAPASPAAPDEPEKEPTKAEKLRDRVMNVVLKNPAIRNMAAAQFEQHMDRAYRDFFKTLPPDQAKRLRELLVSGQVDNLDLYMKLADENLPKTDRNAIFKELQARAEENRKQIADLLGKDGLAKLAEYEQTAHDRTQVAGLKDAMYGAGLDLTDEQSAALVAMMQEARERKLTAEEDAELYALATLLPEERNITWQESNLRWQEVYYRRYLAEAERILSPEQLKVYEQYLRQQLDVAETFADFKPQPLPESTDRAPVVLGRANQTLSTPVEVPAHGADFHTWGDNQHGSKLTASNTANRTLQINTTTGDGWGCGITFTPTHHARNSDNSIDASGAKQVVARVKAPAGATLRFGILESGADWPGAGTYNGVNGADGEAFRHEGITTQDGWQTYTIPISEFRLLGGYGNQGGNRIIDAQALRGIEILYPGGQPDATIEVEWIKLQ